MVVVDVEAMPLLLVAAWSASAQQMRLDLAEKRGRLEIDRIALGQGGLSEQPMWDDRVNEIRILRPRLIRLFIRRSRSGADGYAKSNAGCRGGERR